MEPKRPLPPTSTAVAPVEAKSVPWRPLVAVLFVVGMFYISQLIGGLLVSIYPLLQHWTKNQTATWLNGSVYAQFIYILIAEAVVIGSVYWFLKLYKRGWATIGLLRPRLRDLAYGLSAVIPYYVFYLISVSVISKLVPSLKVDQQQQIGFTNVHGGLPLALTFISLVILPPLTEEILVRGFLYSSLKKALPLIWAAVATSLVFAAAHLPEGGAAGPLYIAAIDTFVLSLVLIYLREKTGSLWAGITLHAIKNGIAFCALFIFHMS
ncbi:MAG: type II CAAX endopeptidase family protein [Patescibacteria group bacterium]|nr:type II CAAX endopeptidase family protein [Patescibacteria group bacterium]